MRDTSDPRGLELLGAIANDASALHVDETDDAGDDTITGACYYCGCTQHDACILEVDDASSVSEVRTCKWYRRPDHRGFGVCSNPECVKDYLADPGAP